MTEIVLYQNGLATVKAPLQDEKTSVILPIKRSAGSQSPAARAPMIETKLPASLNTDNVFLIYRDVILPNVTKLTELGETGDSTMIRFRLQPSAPPPPELRSRSQKVSTQFLGNPGNPEENSRWRLPPIDEIRILYSDKNFKVSWYVTHVARLNSEENTAQLETKLHLTNYGNENRGPAVWKLMVQEEPPNVEAKVPSFAYAMPQMLMRKSKAASNRSEAPTLSAQAETQSYAQVQMEETSKESSSLSLPLPSGPSPTWTSLSSNTINASGSSQAESYEFTLQEEFALPKQSSYELTLFRSPKVALARKYIIDLPRGHSRNLAAKVVYFIQLSPYDFAMNNLGRDGNGLLPQGKLSLYSDRLQLLATFNAPNFNVGKKTRIGSTKDNRVSLVSGSLEVVDHVVDDAKNEVTSFAGSAVVRNQHATGIWVYVRFPYYRDIIQWDRSLPPTPLRWKENKARGTIVMQIPVGAGSTVSVRFAFVSEDRIKKQPPVIRVEPLMDALRYTGLRPT